MAESKPSLLKSHDFMDREIIQSPFKFYQALRNEAPVYQLPKSPIPGKRVFVVSTYKLIREDVLPDWKTYSNRFGALMGQTLSKDPEIAEIEAQGYEPVDTMLTEDPPAQRKYRSIVSPAFSMRRVAGWDAAIEQIANDLIDQFEQKGEADFLKDFSIQLPIYVIADAIGVPRQDHKKIKGWADAAIAAISRMQGRDAAIESARASVEMQHYLVDLLEKRRQSPEDDILTILVNAKFDEDRGLTNSEMLSILRQLMIAGHETTTNALGGGLVYILSEPGAQAKFIETPDLLDNAVEEILRLEASTKGMWRIVNEDTTLGGVSLKQGDVLFLSYDSANRDEAVFENGDACQFDRSNASQHLSFGAGIHSCIGALLAKKEMRIAFELLLTRLPNLRLTPGRNSLEYLESLLHRGFRSLHISFDAPRAGQR
ncbi:cytochrome P450 [Henriciella litoralis]|uniref:cytochrome P450 n=1 Tax=Henriciella litoralis TaxID=568102 RepID=UPI000A02E6BA|nr:cytochrome P450 [Henriciella litoralis]